jgi:Phage tail protein
MTVNCYIDNVDTRDYGVHVSQSYGLTGKPDLKKPVSMDWVNYHGQSVYLTKKYYEARTIKLDCFIKASDSNDFIYKMNAFFDIFDKPFTSRLAVTVDNSEPLCYEVYLEDGIDIKKTWSSGIMIGTFTLTLKEPEPIKKVYKYQRTSSIDKTVSFTLTSSKMLNIYWGDGSHTFDCSGTSQTYTHDYSSNGYFYIVITGNIDEISSITSTATLVWNKL